MDPITINLILSLCSIVILTLAKPSDILRNICLGLLFLNFTLILIYLTADKFSLDGFNESALAHFHYVLDPNTLLRFWPIVFGTITALAGIILGLWLYNKTLKLKFNNIQTSGKMTALARFSAPAIIILTIALNPLTLDLTLLYKKNADIEKTTLPADYQNIGKTAPPIVYNSPDVKPNFIIIFAESLESTFLNSDIYPSLMPTIQKLINDRGVQINGINEVTLSNWTDAGLVAALCGASMTLNYSDFGLEEVEISSEIRARIRATNIIGETCIGDFLHQDNYDLSFFGGSEFGLEGKTMIFNSQGFDQFYSTEQILSSSKEPLSTTTWGVYDDALIDFVENNISKQKTQPFGKVLLTVDTHTPGFISPSCGEQRYKDGSDILLNSVHCADQIVGNFIAKQLDNPKFENTTIFLMSDHLLPGKLPGYSGKRNKRENLFVVFNSKLTGQTAPASITRSATPLDLGPTIMAHLGYDIKTLNFGRNLMRSEPTLAEALGHSTLSINIVKLRRQMRAHWKEVNNAP